MKIIWDNATMDSTIDIHSFHKANFIVPVEFEGKVSDVSLHYDVKNGKVINKSVESQHVFEQDILSYIENDKSYYHLIEYDLDYFSWLTYEIEQFSMMNIEDIIVDSWKAEFGTQYIYFHLKQTGDKQYFIRFNGSMPSIYVVREDEEEYEVIDHHLPPALVTEIVHYFRYQSKYRVALLANGANKKNVI
jgi:hypothetical protein